MVASKSGGNWDRIIKFNTLINNTCYIDSIKESVKVVKKYKESGFDITASL